MDIKNERVVAYGIAVVLFVVGVVCYAGFPPEPPEEPIRIYFTSTAGNLLFDHKEHTSEEGYGFDCAECHHKWEQEEGTKPEACGKCHLVESEKEDVPKRTDSFHQQCKGCHEEAEEGPIDCFECHFSG